MKTSTNKMSANRSSKRSHALKELLEKQETNLLEIREDLPFETDSQTVNMRTVQFGGDEPVLRVEPATNVSAAIGIFHGLIAKEIASAAVALEIDGQELKAWIDHRLPIERKAEA